MRRIALLFVLICAASVAMAQQYEMHIKVRLRYNNNHVRNNSYFRLVFHTNDPDADFEWRRMVRPDQSEWNTYEKTFMVEQEHLVKTIDVITRRETSGSDSETGSDTIRWSPLSYPCGYREVDKKLDAFESNSTVTITIRPLSLGNQFAIVTEADIVSNRDRDYFMYSVEAKFTDGTSLTLEPGSRRRMTSATRFTGQCLVIVPTRKRIKQIWVTSYMEDHSDLVPKITESTEKIDVIADNGGDLTLEFGENEDPYNYIDITSTLKIRYYKPLTSIGYAPTGDQLTLPSDNKISLTVDEVNNETFIWQYRTATSATFTNVPATFGTDQILSISGKELFTTNWQTQLFANVEFKALYTCFSGRETDIITLAHLPSAPGIVSVDSVLETCNGRGDGKLRIKFDRPLYSDETLYVGLNGLSLPPFAPGAIDAGNTLTVDERVPNTYNITLLTTFTAKGNGYAGGTNHRATIVLPPRPAITAYTATVGNVHCSGGTDGLVTVSAVGGTGNFTASLQQGSTSTSQGFLAPATTQFTNLAAGNYSIRLTDSNGCEPKSGSTSLNPLNRTVAQPANGVMLTLLENIEPLAYGHTNGRVTVLAESGTFPFTFTWTDGNNVARTPQAPVTQGSNMTSTLASIGKGTYRVIARDNAYALVTNTTPLNLKGCVDTLTVEVTEPPVLVVNLKEKHFISCFGDDDGEVSASAKGGRPFAVGHINYPYQYTWYTVSNGTPSPFAESDSIAQGRAAAVYRVSITDKNGIVAWSPDFTLTQPQLLKINFNTPPLLCNGDADGTSTATPTGGTAPFTYAWSTEATTPSISGLAEGSYSLFVTDVRGCKTLGITEVTVPESIDADPQLAFPTCSGGNDGSITLNVSGGVAPYQYAWSSGQTSRDLLLIGQGSYDVRITDKNNCFIERTYELRNPDLAPLELGEDRILCKDQTLSLDVAHADATAYAWTQDGVSFASSPTVVLTEPGVYAIARTDIKGCVTTDQIEIGRTGSAISASIIVASKGPMGERIRVANISHPAPERIEWILPSEATVLSETTGYVDLLFEEKGEYAIGLKGFSGPCEALAWSKLNIVDAADLTEYETPKEPFIRQFIVTPNPNRGQFQVTVELGKVSDFKVKLSSMQGVTVSEYDVKGQDYARIDFDVAHALGSGLYVVQLISEEGYSVFKIAIE